MPHELGVLANIGRDHLSDLLRFQKHAKAEVVNAAIVGGDRQVLRASLADGSDQQLRNTTKTEAAGREKHPVEQQAIKGCLRALVNLVHNLPHKSGIGSLSRALVVGEEPTPRAGAHPRLMQTTFGWVMSS
uniref:3-oxoacid CoA-transferase, subunit A n=1 Tax=Rhizobium meliloti TaxID=382 RepID=I2E1Y4_RHIML|nr:3-oxoacid CoA-transferase, subunit A [Sinorhizobium meliloti]